VLIIFLADEASLRLPFFYPVEYRKAVAASPLFHGVNPVDKKIQSAKLII